MSNAGLWCKSLDPSRGDTTRQPSGAPIQRSHGRGPGAPCERPDVDGPVRSEHAVAVHPAERPRVLRREVRLRARAVRGVQGAGGRRGAAHLPRAGDLLSAPCHRHHRGARRPRASASDTAGVRRGGGRPVRLLHPRYDHRNEGAARPESGSDRRGDPRRARHPPLPLRDARAHPAGGATRGARDAPMSDLPSSLARHPDLDTWIRVDPPDTITLFTGKVELGQGLKTAIARIGAEELDVDLERVRVSTADTVHGLNELFTVGSQSMEESGVAMRQAAAEARHHLLKLAATRLDPSVDRLEIEDGSVVARDTGRRTTYWELLGGRLFNRAATGAVDPKRPEAYHI